MLKKLESLKEAESTLNEEIADIKQSLDKEISSLHAQHESKLQNLKIELQNLKSELEEQSKNTLILEQKNTDSKTNSEIQSIESKLSNTQEIAKTVIQVLLDNNLK